jgi:hypothetical protein
MFFYDAHVSFEQPDVCGSNLFKGEQLDPLTVCLFMSRDMYTEKDSSAGHDIGSPGFRVPAAKCPHPPPPRLAECRMLNFPRVARMKGAMRSPGSTA